MKQSQARYLIKPFGNTENATLIFFNENRLIFHLQPIDFLGCRRSMPSMTVKDVPISFLIYCFTANNIVFYLVRISYFFYEIRNALRFLGIGHFDFSSQLASVMYHSNTQH